MSFEDNKLNRRELIKLAGVGASSIFLGGCITEKHGHIPMMSPYGYGLGMLEAVSPFDRTLGDTAPLAFSGDNPSRAHKILWEKKKFVAQLGSDFPKPTEEANVVVVGGGVSGLLTTYMLRRHEPVLLEQNNRFGGNSRGESWGGIDYSLATAYFGVPEKDGPIDKLFKEIGVDGRYRVHDTDDFVFIGGKKYDNIWRRGTIPANRHQFRKLAKHFKDVVEERNGKKYPRIPANDADDRAYVNDLDKMTFKEYCEKIVGGPLHPHAEEVIEHYFWSAAAASYTEISAAGGLNFFAGDFDKVAILPGGNGAIAEALLVRLFLEVPKRNLRASSLVFDVRADDKGALVSYLDPEDKLRTIRAKAVVMSCPKFVAAHLIDDLETDRREIIEKKMRYRSYLVANILVNRHLSDNFYDLFFFKNGDKRMPAVESAAEKQRVTDFVYGNFAKPNPERTVLTIFRGFPYDNVRKELLAPDSYQRFRKEFEEQIASDILPLVNLTQKEIVDLRIARWGHPLPVIELGHIAEGRVDVLRRPYKNRVFFVEQDNWALPAFETAFYEASHFAPLIEDFLKKS